MKIAYLDQNVASYLAKSKPEPIWLEIRDVLVEGFRNRKLICPLPFEGVMETAPMPLERRKAIQSLFWQLSEGVAFKAFTEISNELTLALIRPVPNWSPWIVWKPVWAEMEEVARKLAFDWKAGKQLMMARMDTFIRSPNLETMSWEKIFQVVAKERSIWVCKDLNDLLEGNADRKSIKCPWLIDFLASEKISPAEIEALKRAIKYHCWAKIPIHVFEILLGARWEYDSIHGGAASYEPNDEIDRKRAAIALSHADLFITEGGLADLCRRAKIDEYCTTLVLSVKNPEKILETIRDLTK